jgi:hypothetical protein
LIYGVIQFYSFFVDFCLDGQSIGDRRVLKSTIIVLGEGVSKSRSVCVMKLGALTLGTYKLTIVVSFGDVLLLLLV